MPGWPGRRRARGKGLASMDSNLVYILIVILLILLIVYVAQRIR